MLVTKGNTTDMRRADADGHCWPLQLGQCNHKHNVLQAALGELIHQIKSICRSIEVLTHWLTDNAQSKLLSEGTWNLESVFVLMRRGVPRNNCTPGGNKSLWGQMPTNNTPNTKSQISASFQYVFATLYIRI